jgi:hypothetical protein
MQKLLTLHLFAWQMQHGTVEEHLTEYLTDGWSITSVTAAGGASDMTGTRVFVAVVLEHRDRDER